MSSRRWFDLLVSSAGLLILGAAALIAFARARGIDLLPDRHLCWSRIFLGADCPGCGLTRSFVALAGGEFARALEWNPLGPVLLPALGLLAALHALRLAGATIPRLGTFDALLASALAGILLAHTVAFYLR